MLAHVAEDGRVHALEVHLEGTAQRASQFAAEFLLDSTWSRAPPPAPQDGVVLSVDGKHSYA